MLQVMASSGWRLDTLQLRENDPGSGRSHTSSMSSSLCVSSSSLLSRLSITSCGSSGSPAFSSPETISVKWLRTKVTCAGGGPYNGQLQAAWRPATMHEKA